MKKLVVLSVFLVAGFAVNAQTTPKAKTVTKKETVAKKNAHCTTGKSCCQNEKALSSLRRPVAKPAKTTKS
jgi:hypothetical protein